MASFGHTTPHNGFRNAALLCAHPGHELRVHGWLERARPLCAVLTRGDGNTGHSRLASTTRVLDAAGARAASIYGRCGDAEIYTAIRYADFDFFLQLLDELVETLITHKILTLVVDAEEGYNPSHDVCRHLGVAAASMAAAATGRPIRTYDFPLVGAPDECPAHLRADCVRLDLDAAAFDRKMNAARLYPEMQAEVARALAANGAAAFRVECLRPAEGVSAATPATPATPPFYEEYGARQVAAGLYPDVITYRHHLLPLQQTLWKRAASLQVT